MLKGANDSFPKRGELGFNFCRSAASLLNKFLIYLQSNLGASHDENQQIESNHQIILQPFWGSLSKPGNKVENVYKNGLNENILC